MKIISAAATLFLILSLWGCGQEDSPIATPDRQPVVLLVLRDLPPSPGFPPLFAEERDDVSAGMLIDDGTSADLLLDTLMAEAVEAGLLAAAITDGAEPITLPPDHISLWRETGGGLSSVPEEIASDFDDSTAFGSMDFHRTLHHLQTLYKPDLMVINLSMAEPSSALSAAQLWASPSWLREFTLVVTRPADDQARGWCLLAGNRINGTVPRGLTEAGLYTTVRILAGMDWLHRIPEAIPAVSVIGDGDIVWRVAGD